MKIFYTTDMKQYYICNCNKVTFEKFDNFLREHNSYDFDLLCKKLKVGNQCASCLPSLEDSFIEVKGNFKRDFTFLGSHSKSVPFYKKILNFLDLFFGDVSLKQKGILPILFGKNISTWMVMSNCIPDSLDISHINYLIKCDIYDFHGKFLKSIKKTVKPNDIFEVCLDKYVVSNYEDEEINIGTAVITRFGEEKGYRGSTRPHFYFKTKGSMAAVHSQFGGTKSLLFEIDKINKNDKGWLFVHNKTKKLGRFNWSVDKYALESKINLNKGEFDINPLGSKLIKLAFKEVRNNEEIKIFINSNVVFKEYFILSSADLKHISVDHT